MASATDPAAVLREHHHGVLEVSQGQGEWSARVRFIIDGRGPRRDASERETGGAALVASVISPIGEGDSVALFVPDESDRSMQVHLLSEPIVDWRNDEGCDRWLAYFGRGDGSNWFRLTPAGYRVGKRVLDADEVVLTNPLHSAEGRLCKLANSGRERLVAIAAKETGSDGTGALCVGVDPRGMDVRVPLGILRLDFGREVGSEEEAREAMGERLGK